MNYDNFFTDQQIVMLKFISVEDFADPDTDLDFGRKAIFDELSRLHDKKVAIRRKARRMKKRRSDEVFSDELRNVYKEYCLFLDFLTETIADFRTVFLLVMAGNKFYGLKMPFNASTVCGPRLNEFSSSSESRWARENLDCACLKPFVSIP